MICVFTAGLTPLHKLWKSLAVNKAVYAAILFVGVTFMIPVQSWAGASSTISPTNAVIDFGSFSILPSCTNCTITISPSGVRSSTGGVVLTTANIGTAATYSVTMSSCGAKNCTYTGTATPASTSMAAGGVTMTTSNFILQQSASLAPNTLAVGATLTIPSSATGGSYAGWSFTVNTTP